MRTTPLIIEAAVPGIDLHHFHERTDAAAAAGHGIQLVVGNGSAH